MAVTEAGTRVKEAAAGSAIVRPWRPPSTGIAATGYGFVEALMASPTLVFYSMPNIAYMSEWSGNEAWTLDI